MDVISVHGNGFIQIYLDETKRLNIWSKHISNQQIIKTDKHNHRFSFNSTVLRGVLQNEILKVSENAAGEYHKYACLGEKQENGNRPLIRTNDKTYSIRKGELQIIEKGSSYQMFKGLYHLVTPLEYPVVTLMEKTEITDITPSVFCLKTEEPDQDFSRYGTPDEILWEIVVDALASTW